MFSVPHFSSYTSAENSQLEIWDTTDSSTKYANSQITFYANYSNTTSSESIFGADFNITFGDTGEKSMTYNPASSLFEYNRSFASASAYQFNITCNGSSLGFTVLNATDYASISAVSGEPVAPTNITVLGSERVNISMRTRLDLC